MTFGRGRHSTNSGANREERSYAAPMKHIVIATCQKMPALTPSDAILAKALEARGARVSAAPWNGPFGPFAAADIVLIRSTWDYFDVADDFAAWIDRLEAAAPVLNPPEILRWNMTKAYLFELAEKSAPVPPMQQINPAASDIAAAMDALDLGEAIVKPLSGGTASGLSKVKRDDEGAILQAASILNGTSLVMPFLSEIATAGETSLIFFGGEFSHAILKTPKKGDIRVQEDHGGASRSVEAPDWAVEEARRILTLCPAETAYARVDAVLFEKSMALMEVELVEPELFFTYRPETADRLAEVLLRGI